MIGTMDINFKLMSHAEIRDHYNIRQFHNSSVKYKDKTTEERVHLNTLLEEYFRETHCGDPKQKSSDKNKLKNKVCQSNNKNASSNYMYFEMWCEKEKFRVMYENSINDNMKYELSKLNETNNDLRKKLKQFEKNISVEEVFTNTSVEEVNTKNPPIKKENDMAQVITNTSPEEVNTKSPPKVYEYVRIDWDNLLESSQNQSERDRIFIDTLRYIGDEVFENYKESIESSYDICPILEKHYDFLIQTWEMCPEKYDIDDKLIGNLYNIVNNSFDAIISS
jgi:hypothetical protein